METHRSRKFFYLWRQYTLKEFFLLAMALALDFIIKRIPDYLLFTKNSLQKYHEKRYQVKRAKGNNLINTSEFLFSLRRNSSDFLVFDQIVIERSLSPIIKIIKDNKLAINYILDCGANVGVSSVYLSKQFPEARILALEPEPDNFVQLKNNILLNNIQNVSSLQKGVWSKKAMLEHDVNFCYAKGWAFSVREPSGNNGTIEVDTIENILRAAQFPTIDYIKMDIEGSEFEVIRNFHGWQYYFDRVKIISVEIHEKRGLGLEIEDVLRRAGFELNKFGELLTAWKK